MKKFLAAAFIAIGLFVAPTTAYAIPTTNSMTCVDSFFGIPAWYKGLQDANNNCSLRPVSNVTATALKIGLNVLQAALVVVAYVTIFMLIRGGFTYMLSAGSSDGMSSAKKIIRNAIIGLVISLLAASIVNAVAGVI